MYFVNRAIMKFIIISEHCNVKCANIVPFSYLNASSLKKRRKKNQVAIEKFIGKILFFHHFIEVFRRDFYFVIIIEEKNLRQLFKISYLC